MATLGITSPRLYGVPGVDSPSPRAWYISPGSTGIREGNVVQLQSSGTITVPSGPGASAFLGLVGPTFGQDISLSTSTSSGTVGNVIVTGTASAGAPATSYYVQLAYTGGAAGANQSIPGAEFVINCAAGIKAAVQVSTAGPYATAASAFAVFVSTYAGGEILQGASLTATATGAYFSIPIPSAFLNFQGAWTAPNSVSASILGLAANDSAQVYATGVGGSFTAGGPTSRLGYWGNPSPLAPPDPLKILVNSVANGQPIEICLKQAWDEALIGTAAGITLDSASGWHIADTTAAANGIVLERVDQGSPQDVNARVKFVFTNYTV